MRSYSKHKALQGFLLQKLHESDVIIEVIIKADFMGCLYAKTLLLSIKKLVIWIVSFVDSEIKVFTLKIWTGNSYQCCQKVVVSVVYMFV